MPNAQTLDIKLAGTPRWLVAAPLGSGSVWVVVLKGGAAQAFLVEAGGNLVLLQDGSETGVGCRRAA